MFQILFLPQSTTTCNSRVLYKNSCLAEKDHFLRGLITIAKCVRRVYHFSHNGQKNLRCLLSMFTNFRTTTQQKEKQRKPSMLSLHQCTNLSLAAQAPLYGLLLQACWHYFCGCTWGILLHSFVPVYRPKKNSPQPKRISKDEQRKQAGPKGVLFCLGAWELQLRG